jgi:DNA polymerase III subunit delta'
VADLVGQDRAVALIERAATHPVHSYLVSGPPGSGLDDAARALAASLMGPEAADRVLRGVHPDVVEVEPEGTLLTREQIVSLLEDAYRSPVEAETKVVVVHEAERMADDVVSRLLKTLEEPPPRTRFVLVSAAPGDILETVHSRCQAIPLVALTEAAAEARLVAEGVDPVVAHRAGRLSGGRIDRARLLAGVGGPVREAFARVPARVDGTGARAVVVTAEVREVVTGAVAALAAGHAAELVAAVAEAERLGADQRTVRRIERQLKERHKRVESRARLDALDEGLTALTAAYRDALVGPSVAPLHDDVPVVRLEARSCLRALDLLADVLRTVRDHPTVNEGLLLERLLLRLPAPG